MAAGAKLAAVLAGAAVLGAVGLYLTAAPDTPRISSTAGTNVPRVTAATDCSKVLSCVAPKFQREASDSCRAPIEELATFAPRWKQLPGDTIFDGYEWLVVAQGSIRYFGHRAEFGNAGGVFSPVAYECDFDPATRRVIDVRVKGAGRS